jgi:hypothetical protein
MTGDLNSNSLIKTTGNITTASAQPTLFLDRGNGSYTWGIYNGGGTDFPTSSFNIANNAGTAVITALDSGNVGIGETVPVAKLHIQGSGTSGQVSSSLILENSSSGTAGLQITGAAGSSHLDFMYAGGPGTGTNTLTTGLAMTLEGVKAGNIGIGTDAPDYKIHVKGAGHQRLKVEKTDAGGDSDISIAGPSDSTGWVLFTDNTAGSNSGVIKYVHSTDKMHFRTNDVDNRLVLSSDGNIGIGTDDPKRPLQVGATTAFPISFNGNYPDIHMNTYYESGWRVHTTGYGAKTTFNGATGEFTFSNTSSSTTAGATFTPNDRFTILANGKIGIQNTAPTSKLEVGVANVKNAIALNGGPNGAATVIEMVDAKSGAYSNVTIDVQLAGAGGYFYQVQVAGTSGSRYQTGGGYTNGTGNFSQSTATGAGWTVSSPSSNLIRFVSNLAGTHPVAWIKIGQGLNADHDEDNVTFTWA